MHPLVRRSAKYQGDDPRKRDDDGTIFSGVKVAFHGDEGRFLHRNRPWLALRWRHHVYFH
ncbi:hypothetical protein AGR5A_Lc50104 [Agrobacterium genomosp. 5 str. CFBP 6626]|nr:hypothetical protein AGR5A_Lc50104 [Agrobacterium genomosp. 5 str. CFBP 6626]